MIRSLSFTYLFVILAVGYLGGTLLFRELPEASTEKMLAIFDARVVDGHDAKFIWPALATISFFSIAFVLSKFKYSRFSVIFIGAVRAVVFGLSSGYLLASGMKIIKYAIWWFPFQLIICFIFLLFCAVLTPPFFLQTTGKKTRNNKALVILIMIGAVVTAIEFMLFYFLLA